MLGDKIRELRKTHNITQKELAAIMGLSRGTINKYETNERTPDLVTVTRMAEYFGVTMDYICDRKATKKEKLAHKFVALFDSKGLTLKDADSKGMEEILEIAGFLLDKYKSIYKKA